MSNPSKYHINAEVVQITEQNPGTIIGKQINQTNDPEIKAAIIDLQTLITTLQTQHPTVTSEIEALTIIDAEFTEIKRNPSHKLATLRKQLLNPERHLQAFKAAAVDYAKTTVEKNPLIQAAITYIDKLSETPDQGA
jgi:hypothetical protein